MEQWGKKAANKIAQSTGADADRTAVIAYGLTGIFQFLEILLAVTLLGVLFGFWPEALILFFSVGLLRRLIGGAHSAGYNSCLLISITLVSLLAALAHYVIAPYLSRPVQLVLLGFIYLFAAVEIYRRAPVEAPNKPIRNPQKIKRLRRNAFLVLTLFVLLTVCLTALDFAFGGYARYTFALALSVLWQVIMLTPFGHTWIGMMDRALHVSS